MPVRARRSPAVLTALLMAAGAVLAGCAQGSSAGAPVTGEVGEQGYVSVDGTTTIVANADRRAAPALSGTTLTGESFSLAEHRGEVVVLNVWASWCAPCRSEATDMAAVATEMAGRATFVGLNTRDSAGPAAAFVTRFALTYPHVVDTDGRLQLLFHDTLPPAAIPSTLVIDRQGRVAARAIGEVDRSRLLGLVEPIVAEEASAGTGSGRTGPVGGTPAAQGAGGS